jgi:enamine deaminase RidA (YjgF/YER057c/UK114 family)
MKSIILASLLFMSTRALCQQDTSIVKLVNPTTVSTPRGFSQAAIIDLGNSKMVIMSGQVALDPKGQLVGLNDFSKQADQVFLNIKSIVESSGGTMDNLVHLGFYVIDVSNVQALRTIRDKYINTKTPPTSTLVQVSRLFRDDVMVEIEATAVIPKK